MDYITHQTFYTMIMSGAKQVIYNEKELNQINVFPVADGDTGSNLAHLMKMITRETKWSESPVQMLDSMKLACMRGSRGNSGMIFSQFIISMCEFFKQHHQLHRQQFIDMCEYSVESSIRSVMDPKEGTILTVMKTWISQMKQNLHQTNEVYSLLEQSYSEVCVSLQNTTHQLPALKQHNVVDAGAKGFVHFIQGIMKGLHHHKDFELYMPEMPEIEENQHIMDEAHQYVSSPKYRYCSEFLFDIHQPIDDLNQQLSSLGDSCVMLNVGSSGKVHIHTNYPERIAATIEKYGEIMYQKVEDMQRQYEMNHCRKSNIALVVDSACDLPQQFLDDHQIHMIPLQVQIDGSSYLDKVTLKTDSFYDRLTQAATFPTTSQPSSEAVQQMYNQLLKQYDHIISIHLSGQLSGTYKICKSIAAQIDSERIHVFDSKTLSGAYGLLTEHISKEIEKGKPIEQLIASIQTSINKSEILVSVPSLQQMVRGGRVTALQGKIANWIKLKPIVSIDKDGKALLYKKTVFQASNESKLLSMVKSIHKQNPILQYVLLYTDQAEMLKNVESQLLDITGKPPIYTSTVSPVIGMNAGQGAISVAMMLRNNNERSYV